MTKITRILIFLIAMAVLSVVFFITKDKFSVSNEVYVLIFSTLIMLSFTALFIEHFFTTPSDVLANTIAILLAISPIRSSLSRLENWYWIFLFYNVLLLITSLLALMLLNSQKSSISMQNRISNFLKRFSTFFGNGQFLFFVLFILTIMFYIDVQSTVFLVLFGYATLILLVNPKKFLLGSLSSSKRGLDVGEIIGINSKNTFISKLYEDGPKINRFDFVEFHYAMNENREIYRGLVIDKYLLNKEQWVKILVSDDIKMAFTQIKCDYAAKSNVVYKLDSSSPPSFMTRYVGIVQENSTIGKIRFEYHSNVIVSEGDLLELSTNNHKVLYQIMQGFTETELLESKNKTGFIVGEAIQLGEWEPCRQIFNKYGWVPDINTPVYLASEIEPPAIDRGEVQLGKIPNTNYPVVMNKESAVTHHLAILGITGCGKSILARRLIREIAQDGIKVVCVDFTNEYRDKFPDYDFSSIISETRKDDLFNAINILSIELEKWPNQQNQTIIAQQENILHDGFFNSIEEFIRSDSNISLFELPDVSNTTGILEYTKWFFKVLFEIARLHNNFGKRLCIVLEEAHTVIPEYTFLGVSEKKGSSLVNNISQIALQGRKYGVGFIVVAQRTANVSKTVLTQCNSIIAFQQFDKTSSDFLSNYMGAELASSISSLKFRQAIAVGKAFRTGIPVIFEVDEITEPIAGSGED